MELSREAVPYGIGTPKMAKATLRFVFMGFVRLSMQTGLFP